MTCRKRTFFTPRPPMLFAASGRGAFLMMPPPQTFCFQKAEIKGFLLMYRLFQYKHWFFPNFELKDFPEYTFTPCKRAWNAQECTIFAPLK